MRKGEIDPGTGSPRTGSQLDVFTHAAAGAGIQHGERVRARVRNVRAERIGNSRLATVFFCHSQVEVIERLTSGDGQPMPVSNMVVEHIGRVPDGHYFDLEGIIESNGRNVFRRTGMVQNARSISRPVGV